MDVVLIMLIHKISIPMEDIREHYTYGMFDSSYLSDELGLWMKENIKHEWNWDSELVLDNNVPIVRSDNYHLVFRFENKEDAMAFKLRWL